MGTLARFALSIGAAGALLAGCGGLQLPIGGAARANQSALRRSGPVLKEYVVKNKKLEDLYQLAFDSAGALWFNSFYPYLGRMLPNGAVTAHALPEKRNGSGYDSAYHFTHGPDGNVWFTDYYTQTIGLVKNGLISQYRVCGQSGCGWTAGIVSARRHLWMVATSPGTGVYSGNLDELTIKPKLVKTIRLPGFYCYPGPLAVGEGETFWIGDSGNCPQITRVTADGAITNFPIVAADGVWNVTEGPDGNVWFTAADGPKTNAWVGKITPDGQITKYSIADQGDGIALGPDGNWWITQPFVGHIISMNLQGQVVNDYKLPGAINGSQPKFQVVGIVKGPDGNMWFAEGFRNKIGELVFPRE
ncbi:MAG TPA: hypothetical protein VMT95_05665 [Candidatus Binatia bacterium]|nr:hypothetical protein [Candidatus Binatia bacterium]